MLLNLHKTNYRGNYQTLKKVLAQFPDLDYSPFKANKIKNKISSLPNEEIFCKNSTANSRTLRKRIEDTNLKDLTVCECCGISSWNGKELTMQIHHKDGDHFNNLPENLEILCPNCHSQTDTYCRNHIVKKINYFIDCGKEIGLDSLRCRNCQNKIISAASKIPSKEVLEQELLNCKNKTEVGRKHGVSHTTINRWIKRYNL